MTLFLFLGLIPPPLNFAKIHARGGGGPQPRAHRDLIPPPRAHRGARGTPGRSAEARWVAGAVFRDDRARAKAGLHRSAGRAAVCAGAATAWHSNGVAQQQARACRGGRRTPARHDGATRARQRAFRRGGQPGGTDSSRRDGRLSGRDACNRGAGRRETGRNGRKRGAHMVGRGAVAGGTTSRAGAISARRV